MWKSILLFSVITLVAYILTEVLWVWLLVRGQWGPIDLRGLLLLALPLVVVFIISAITAHSRFGSAAWAFLPLLALVALAGVIGL